jgi:hypothetical protein
MGWVHSQLIDPQFHFHYFGFEWVAALPAYGIYAVFVLLVHSCIGIIFGWYYRLSAILFFVCFTYVELIDVTYYLNHYYFVSIVAFLLILVPANRYFSLDVQRNPELQRKQVSRWCIGIFKVQIAIVYLYAGLAKINYDWLIRALPLSIWLPAKTSIPVIGWVLKFKITAYLFSWLGMLFDTFIIAGLWIRKTRVVAYLSVIVFHTLTGILFQIGIFPLVMIFSVTLFFSEKFHENLLQKLSHILQYRHPKTGYSSENRLKHKLTFPFLFLFFFFQVLFPWRYLLYDGNVFWTEEGYRFAWRVMLMEKAGSATFFVKDGEHGKEGSVINRQFLNPHQEKQMAMQPDMILQFAHHLGHHFKNQGMKDPRVRAEVWVTLNAAPSRLLIDPTVDLTQKTDGWRKKDWILPQKLQVR